MLLFSLINVKMPPTVGILTFMSWKNSMLSSVEHEKSFMTSEPGLQLLSYFERKHNPMNMVTKYIVVSLLRCVQCS